MEKIVHYTIEMLKKTTHLKKKLQNKSKYFENLKFKNFQKNKKIIIYTKSDESEAQIAF